MFFNLVIDESLQSCTDIRAPDWQTYVYQRMPFGIKTAPQLFQGYIEKVLFGIEDMAVYVDDVIIFLKAYRNA